MSENKFKIARLSAQKSLQACANVTELSISTFALREESPKNFRLYELKKIYDSFPPTAQKLLLESINEFFLNSDMTNYDLQ